jgi:hypothetical protein
MTGRHTEYDPVPARAWPTLTPVDRAAPVMPPAWKCVALLHPFSPPPSHDPKPDTPFFQLCVANVSCVRGQYLSAQITGCSYGSWWYVVTAGGTKLSVDGGKTWTPVHTGWTVPTSWFGDQTSSASCAGASPLNWMAGPTVNWWKVPVPLPDVGHRGGSASKPPPAATWMWFASDSDAPIRMMFGDGPPTPNRGDPRQLALFQMYSFTYVPQFAEIDPAEPPTSWVEPTFPGFAVGNPKRLSPFVWSSNFGFTALMTPVNETFDPLSTRLLYVWKPDDQYATASDRAQSTLMRFPPGGTGRLSQQEALLMGHAPAGIRPPPDSDTGFLVSWDHAGQQSCVGGSAFPFAQEPPDWITIPAVDARIAATITDNPVLCPGETVAIYSALFPKAPPKYPEATYLWTWYSPVGDSDGRRSRPVTFMQSQSGVGVGTSLALADYFYWEEFPEPIDPANFRVPEACRGCAG